MRFSSALALYLSLAIFASLSACSSERRTTPDSSIFPDAGTDSGVAGTCGNGRRDGTETGIDCGGDCSPCADGQMCAVATDCQSAVCRSRYCLVPSCTDGVLNGSETGTDCGGTCGRCRGGVTCTAGADCLSGMCLADMTCADSGCEDGEMNQDETGVDCGGSLCPPCPGGQGCLVAEHCESLICDVGTCTSASCTDRVQNQDETSIDCGGGTCPGCRDGFSCLVDPDCEGSRCVAGACVSCMDGVQNAEETDVDCGGGLCDPCMDREMCMVAADCAGGACEASLCVSCVDGVQNQDESDIDCGGTVCTGCGTGFMCGAATDCTSGVCAAGTSTCNAPGCGDGVLNGVETDVDCGGGSCLGCVTGLDCSLPRDCLSGVCTAGVCQAPTCTDGVRNGVETDVDCGGTGSGCPRCMDRQRCSAATDCMSATCTTPPGRCGTFSGCFWGLISQETQFTDTTIQGLFSDSGHTFDVLSANGTTGVHSSNAATLAMYDHIVFHKHDRVLTGAELTALNNFVNGGGRLIVTGYDSLGSPTDLVLAGLVRCASPGDGPFSSALSVVDATHGIMRGPEEVFTMGQALTASGTNHDQCTPMGGATRLVSVTTSSKLQITESIGASGGMVVFWNGNGSVSGPLTDWNGAGTTASQPSLQNLFVNTLEYLCATP